MYILVAEQLGTEYFWFGNGTVTRQYNLAKRYKTWQAANKACYRIKALDFKFMSEEDYQEKLRREREALEV